ncbi:cysteine hydrolase family protein [Marinifilum sp. D737]|uniref:cysteine hydrolase family protein n=1 Tax=Marinifilum sp. D737 TaxID=2969628 RepID=UPI0022750F58|nr:cysteine hydrolase family protein [Marinifilum sp. D737]MCY1635433.1 cysteine hydrolase [Marinifilum sp. D737]
MSLKEQNAALILIDFQKGFDQGEYLDKNRNNIDAEKKASIILNKWRELNLPVFHIIHNSINPNSHFRESRSGFEIKDEVKPIKGEPVIKKNVHSAFIGTDLKERLDKQGINSLVIIGMTTNHCVSTSTRMAGDFGFDTFLISDATATFDRIGINGEKFSAEIIHQTALSNLNNDFAKVVDTKRILELVE